MPPENILSRTEARDSTALRKHREFLPAALEIIETAASPAGRLVAITIAMAALVAIAWACIGQVDVIATASGRVVPIGNSKVIQPIEIGVVTAIHVADGDSVRVGEMLIELDPTQTGADNDRIVRDLRQARLDRARLKGLRAILDVNRPPMLVDPPPDATSDEIATAQTAMRSRADEQSAKLADLAQQISERISQGNGAIASAERLRASLPFIQKQVDLREELIGQKYTNEMAYLTAKQQLVEQQHQIIVLEQQKTEAEAATAALERRREQVVAEYGKTLFEDLDKTEHLVNQLQSDLAKAKNTLDSKALRAPIDGTVQQLAVHTIGAVVTPAQPLLVIVPNVSNLTVEAMVNNRDIGFVHPGQTAEVKIDTFNFTRYGLVDGTVTTLSRDSVTQNIDRKPSSKMGDGSEMEDLSSQSSAYVAHIALSRNWMDTETGRIPLGPGMTVTTEIHTGKRRIIDFLLSPLARKVDESLHER